LKSIKTTGLRFGWSKDKAKGGVVGESRSNEEEPKKSRMKNVERQTRKRNLSSLGGARSKMA